MSNKFDIYINYYSLQWFKAMRTGSALLHHWSAVVVEFDLTIRHWPGKDQSDVGGLSRLPIEEAPPDGEEAALAIQTLTDEEAA